MGGQNHRQESLERLHEVWGQTSEVFWQALVRQVGHYDVDRAGQIAILHEEVIGQGDTVWPSPEFLGDIAKEFPGITADSIGHDMGLIFDKKRQEDEAKLETQYKNAIRHAKISGLAKGIGSVLGLGVTRHK